MKTLLKTLDPIRMFSSLKRLQEEMKNDPKCFVRLALIYNKRTLMGVLLYIWPVVALKGLLAVVSNSTPMHANDSYGRTPLHAACGIESLEVVQTLIQHHADVNATANAQ